MKKNFGRDMRDVPKKIQGRWAAIGSTAIFTCLTANYTGAQTPANEIWEEHSRHASLSRSVSPVGRDAFGEAVDLYDGRLSFQHKDVEIPGNFDIPVQILRSLNIPDPIVADQWADVSIAASDSPFGDWDLEIPRIEVTWAHELVGVVLDGNGIDPNPVRNFTWGGNRCSGNRVAPLVGNFFAADYWNGIHAKMPGGGELLQPNPGIQAPQDGGSHRWVTKDLTWFSCLPSIKNAEGEGFLAIDTKGTRYYFDWLSSHDETTVKSSFLYMVSDPAGGFEEVFVQELKRRRNVLYVTRVEDRFGNWVNYEFSNSSIDPARLDSISSSDGRSITLAYNDLGRIQSVSTSGSIWSYAYEANRGRLAQVNLPDSTFWRFDLSQLIDHIALSQHEMATCSFPGGVATDIQDINFLTTVTIDHPTGARGDFIIEPLLYGRSNVPKRCLGVPDGHGKPENGAHTDYVRMYWTNSLIGKIISGLEVPMSWTYTYHDSQKRSDARSGFSEGYEAPGSWAEPPYTFVRIPEEGLPDTDISTYIVIEPICQDDSCAGRRITEVTKPNGDWEKFYFGNSYRYDEGVQLRTEFGKASQGPNQVGEFSHVLLENGHPFQRVVGVTRQYRGDSFLSGTRRPQASQRYTQDGVQMSSTVDAFDEFSRPVTVRKEATGVP